jgi:DNA-binding CsgD family transcriptional regulator/tetratricopeptide (TPR) repeat protein
MVGLLVAFGDALVGQGLAQPGMLVVHGSHPFLQLSRIDRCWLRMGRGRAVRIWQVPYAGRCPVPYLWSLAATVPVSLWPDVRDNPGEMGGRVQSPTFVGRVEELQVLEVARRRAANGEPAVVLLGGEAGVGKTRLVAELTARCAADGIRVLAGGCVPVGGDGLPFAPIMETLRPLPEELGADTVRELAGPSWRELARLLPALGEPEGGPAGQVAQARLFELLLGLLARLSQQTPVTLVVEDLHWADQSTRDLLAFLVRNLRRERILAVFTYRNDEPRTDRLGPWLAELDRGGPVRRLELARLDRAETVAQLVGILGAVPATDLIDELFGRSEGNPFFTEELLAAVQADTGALPPTLEDLLRGRVQLLPDHAQQVLGVAAVAGRQVSHRLLATVADLDDRELAEALRVVVAHRLLVTRPGGDGYQFRHALLREVVDADLLPGDRARLHAEYARALTNRPELADAAPAVAAAELAIHWDAAGEPGQALAARIQAGLAAEGAHAVAEAARHFQRALVLWDRVPDRGRPAGLDRVVLLVRTADAIAFAGAAQPAAELLQDALGRVDPAAEPARAAVLLARLGDHRRVAGDEAGALAAFEQAERLLAGTPPSAERARVLAAHAYALGLSLRPEEAIGRSEEAVACARAVGARLEEAKALRVLAGDLAALGQPDRAITLALEARAIAEEVDDAETIIGTYLAVSFALKLVGRERDALEEAQQGFQRARELGLERATGSFIANNLAMSLLDTGRWTECERLTRELLAGDRWGAFNLHNALGRLLSRRGEFAAAREQLQIALRLSPPFFSDWAWLGLAELALWEGRYDAAGAAVAEGLHWCTERDPQGTLPDVSSPWYSFALRLEAERAEQAAARQAPGKVAEARRRATPVLAALDRLATTRTPQARYPPVAAHLQAAQAERFRLEGRSDPERWRAAAAAWERLEHPYDAAYARFRQAEALLAERGSRLQAEQVLHSAYRAAATLGAGPLRREVELLAQRGRLDFQEQVDATAAPEAPPSPATSLGLTQRETEVLALVAEGRTNRQIGQALFITEKTASLHVSHILTKLGVAGRGEAAAIAHRLGLDKQ